MPTKRTIIRSGVLIVALLLGTNLSAQQHDSVRNLTPISITEQAPSGNDYSAPTPQQQVSAKLVEQRDLRVVADAVRQMAGVALKDYGGMGGIKTVTVRGLGSQFTTLTIDGVPTHDCLNGQADLGRYSITHGQQISLSVAHDAFASLPTASSMASAAVLDIVSLPPSTDSTRAGVNLAAGSFATFNPSIWIEQRLSRPLAITASASYLRSEGNYPFSLYYSTARTDSVARLRREHSQLWNANVQANLFYDAGPRSRLHVKTYYLQGRNNLPGPVILYNTTLSDELTRQQLFFVQTSFQHHYLADEFGDHLGELQLRAKYHLSNDQYDDLDTYRPHHNTYAQREALLSAASRVRIVQPFSVSLSSDLTLNTLHSNLSNNNSVRRLTSITVLAARLKYTRLEANAHLLATLAHEQVDNHATLTLPSASHSRVSSFAAASLQPFANVPLRLRYHVKQTYRLPTFNEMYFFTIARNLRPEQALQHNLGLSFLVQRDNRSLQTIHASIDVYRNHVNDKIIALPTNNMFLWSMQNVAKVNIMGLDLRCEGRLNFNEAYGVHLSASYSLQHAKDDTEGSATNGNQLPYTPQHSAIALLSFTTPYIDLAYDLQLVGVRYSSRENTRYTRLPAYTDHGIVVSRIFSLPHGKLKTQLHVLNIFDCQYEVVRSYPMMGRNYRLSLSYEI